MFEPIPTPTTQAFDLSAPYAADLYPPLTSEQERDARNWIKECVDNPVDVDDASLRDIRRWVHRHFDGGLDAFLADY